MIDFNAMPSHLLCDMVRNGLHMLLNTPRAYDKEIGDRAELAQVHNQYILRLLLQRELAQSNGKMFYLTKRQ